MKAVVLVGGQGTRLRPLTLTTPKQMLPVAGRPMIERVVAHLGTHGVDEVVLSLGYRPDAFAAAYPDGRCAGVAVRYAVEPEPLDTAGGIAFAARWAGIDEPFVVHNGDVLTDLDVGALVAFHRGHGGQATVSLTPVDDPWRYGVVVLEGDGRVDAFIEKPAPGAAPSKLINAGTYVLQPEVLDRIPAGGRVSMEREVFPALVADRALYAMASVASWVDAGTVATYLAVNLATADREQRWVDDGADVHPTASVTRSLVGGGAAIGEHALVEDSMVMGRARVGRAATVRDSILGAGAVIGDGAIISAHSVVGDDVAVAPGDVVSGERIPKDAA